MTRRTRRSRPWFGAVSAILLLALPVQADDIEPEPYVEEEAVESEPEPYVEEEAVEPESEPEPEVVTDKTAETETAAAGTGPSVGSKIFDCAVLRPFGFVATIVGGAFFVPAAVLASASGAEGIQVAWEHFVITPVENTFKRPLGDF
jgi:hypothetical protein